MAQMYRPNREMVEIFVTDPARFELTTSAFRGQRSIQMSYGSGAEHGGGLGRRNARWPAAMGRSPDHSSR